MAPQKKKLTAEGKPDEQGGREAIHSTSLRLSESLYQRLRKLAFDQQRDMKEVIIEGIEFVLKREKY